ncbi:hypothetical protein [Nonomuraea jabiensis]|uniref:hypothetical protein n=1 Tax=Nonomuraea jabiensis TaxID=882448 RepID=UPI003D761647
MPPNAQNDYDDVRVQVDCPWKKRAIGGSYRIISNNLRAYTYGAKVASAGLVSTQWQNYYYVAALNPTSVPVIAVAEVVCAKIP